MFALSKGGGGMHRPKKGPAYVMSGDCKMKNTFALNFCSDFFVYTIPEEWDRLGIRTTPTSSWVGACNVVHTKGHQSIFVLADLRNI